MDFGLYFARQLHLESYHMVADKVISDKEVGFTDRVIRYVDGNLPIGLPRCFPSIDTNCRISASTEGYVVTISLLQGT